jgi:hypothetical protein
MAITKNITVPGQIINNTIPYTTATGASFTSDPIVQDGVLKVNFRNSNPGVFTTGTAPEGYGTNFIQDSNS